MAKTEQQSDAEWLRSILQKYFNYYDAYDGEEEQTIEVILDRFAAIREETAKAYGGCENCFGKGYASVRAGFTIRGTTYGHGNKMKFCICDRGKQLEKQFDRVRAETLDAAEKALPEKMTERPDDCEGKDYSLGIMAGHNSAVRQAKVSLRTLRGGE